MAYNDQQYSDGSIRENVTLASNLSATGDQPATTVYGGDYVFSVTAGAFNGASVQLQSAGPDGTTYQNLGSAKTANDTTGGTGIGLGSNAKVRITISGGTPTGLYASLSRLP
ncbi:hypothetical protein [Sphingomonas beigongshangi]|uniref:hypothetical protein n=1 Tax=Sphingomonas beigongshangi TaxID=2782540 RepID=UPI00193C4978|nr:hypothetical protein [Sphingomonas beigongshangi]